MPQVPDFFKPKLTLTELGDKLVVFKVLKGNPQMLIMLFCRLQVDQNIIDENNDKLIYIGCEYLIHQVHQHRRGISQTEWHNQKLIMPIPSVESCLQHIFRTNNQLMIP